MPSKVKIQNVGGHAILKTQMAVRIYLPEDAETRGIDPDSEENRTWRNRDFDLTRKPPLDWGQDEVHPEYVRVVFIDGTDCMLRMSHQAFRKEWLRWLRERNVTFPGNN